MTCLGGGYTRVPSCTLPLLHSSASSLALISVSVSSQCVCLLFHPHRHLHASPVAHRRRLVFLAGAWPQDEVLPIRQQTSSLTRASAVLRAACSLCRTDIIAWPKP